MAKKYTVLKEYPSNGWAIMHETDDEKEAREQYIFWVNLSDLSENVRLVTHVAASPGQGDLPRRPRPE